MREVVVGVYHHDCWGSGSTEKFPLISLQETGPISMLEKTEKGVLIDVAWKLNAPNAREMNRYLDHVKKLKSIKRLDVVAKYQKTAILTTRFLSPTSSYDAVLKSKCVHISHVVQENGFEIHPVLCEKTNDVTRLLGELEQIGEVKIFRIGKFRPEENRFNLTEKQEESIRTALVYNYYSWPRNITLEELSKITRSKRRTFQENLRKAEAKMLPGLIKNALES